MKVLFVVPYAPTRIRTRPFHLIRALRADGHDVTVATVWTNGEERAALAPLAGSANGLVVEHLSAARMLWNCLRALPGTEPLQAHFSWSPRLADRIEAEVRRVSFDAVHVEHLRGVRYGVRLTRLLANGVDRPALVWDSVDCISSLFRRTAREGGARRVRLAARFELSRTERYEGSLPARFDRVLVTSETDRHELLQLTGARTLPAARIEVVPNGVDLDYFSPPADPREPRTLVVTGKMSYHANATAVCGFVQDVMPHVWSAQPSVRLWIVGKDPTPEVRKLGQAFGNGTGHDGLDAGHGPRVLVTGTVDDLRPFLRKATLAVAPIRYGVGIQNKVLEAMACATPVVATAQAASGLGARHGEDLAVASTPNALAQAVIDLLNEPARREAMARAGRAFVEREHSWHSVAARVADIYQHARQA